jgi:hypothetical protein
MDQNTTPIGMNAPFNGGVQQGPAVYGGFNPTAGGYYYGGFGNMTPQDYNQKNNLTGDEINKLIKKDNALSLAVTETEALRAMCNHRTADGTRDTLEYDPQTGEAYCVVCQKRFVPVTNMSQEDVKDVVQQTMNVIQTIKLIYKDMPVDVSRQFWTFAALLEKIPELYDVAQKNYAKYDSSMNWMNNSGNMASINMFNNLQNMFNAPNPMLNAMGGNPAMGGYGYTAPQQPVNAFGYNNGFGYPGAAPQQPVNGYQPQSQGYQFNPAANPVPQATPSVNVPGAAPAPQQDVTVTKKVDA